MSISNIDIVVDCSNYSLRAALTERLQYKGVVSEQRPMFLLVLLLVRAECMRCPDALQKGYRVNVFSLLSSSPISGCPRVLNFCMQH